MASPWRKIVLWAVWVILVGAGLAALTLMHRAQQLAATEAAAANWMPLSAKVISATVRPLEHRRPIGPRFRRVVNYGYAVDGVEYTSTRYSFGGDQEFRTEAQAKAATPGVGQPLEIYFDPGNPSQSVVVRSTHPEVNSNRFRGEMGAIAGGELVLLVLAAKEMRRRRRLRSAALRQRLSDRK